MALTSFSFYRLRCISNSIDGLESGSKILSKIVIMPTPSSHPALSVEEGVITIISIINPDKTDVSSGGGSKTMIKSRLIKQATSSFSLIFLVMFI